jgi:phosphate/sulfate permease
LTQDRCAAIRPSAWEFVVDSLLKGILATGLGIAVSTTHTITRAMVGAGEEFPGCAGTSSPTTIIWKSEAIGNLTPADI